MKVGERGSGVTRSAFALRRRRGTFASMRCAGPLVALAAMVLVPARVFASPSKAAEGDTLIRESLDRARVAFNLRDYAQASIEWQAAYRAAKLPVLLFNIAQAERLQKHFEEAYDYYDAYLRDEVHYASRPPKNEEEAKTYRDQMKAKMEECKAHSRRLECRRPKKKTQLRSDDAH